VVGGGVVAGTVVGGGVPGLDAGGELPSPPAFAVALKTENRKTYVIRRKRRSSFDSYHK
jgi:hypothetical protein